MVKLPLIQRIFTDHQVDLGNELIMHDAIACLDDEEPNDGPACLQYLLEQGVHLAERFDDDLTMVEYAREMGRDWAVAILENWLGAASAPPYEEYQPLTRPMFKQYLNQ